MNCPFKFLKQAAIGFKLNRPQLCDGLIPDRRRQADPFQTLEKHSHSHSAAINLSVYLFNKSRQKRNKSGNENEKRRDVVEERQSRGTTNIKQKLLQGSTVKTVIPPEPGVMDL